MNTKRIFTILLFTFMTGILVLDAQQTPKKTPITKTPAKKIIAKKKSIAKKTGNVFISDGGYFYHSNANCAVFKKCKGRILNIPKQQASGQYSCKPCKKCY